MAEYIYITEAKFTVQKKYQSLNRKGNLKKIFGRRSTGTSFEVNEDNFEETINEIIDYVENEANPLMTGIKVEFVDDIDRDFKSLNDFKERAYKANKRVCAGLRKISRKAIKAARQSSVPGHLQAAQKLDMIIDTMENDIEYVYQQWNDDLDAFAEEWTHVRVEGKPSNYVSRNSYNQLSAENDALRKKLSEITTNESVDELLDILTVESSVKKTVDKSNAVMMAKLKALKKKIEKTQKDLPKKTNRIADLARGIKTRIKNTVNKIKKAINKN